MESSYQRNNMEDVRGGLTKVWGKKASRGPPCSKYHTLSLNNIWRALTPLIPLNKKELLMVTILRLETHSGAMQLI